jgi:putative selenium metabolism hydrolase
MNYSQLTAFTQDLLREQSLSGQESGVVERIVDEMGHLGFDRVWIDSHGSAIGVIEGALPGPLLLLDGHCDTVDAVPNDWQHDPFGAEIEDGFLYGRGAADMKGSLAAMIYAAGDFASPDARKQIHGKIAVSATVSEEVMEGSGLWPIVEELQPDFVIIGEATGLNLNLGGRGRAEIVVETKGKPAHSSSPSVGRCAVHEMMRLIEQLDKKDYPTDPQLGQAQMVLTDIISDPYPGRSVIPGRCRCTYDRRLLTGETPESVIRDILAVRDGIDFTAYVLDGEEQTYTGKDLRGQKFFPAWKVAQSHSLVEQALLGLRDSGLRPSLGAYRFCTNGSYSAGVKGIPTIGFGLGQEEDAHVVDERLSLSELASAARGYAGMISRILSK